MPRVKLQLLLHTIRVACPWLQMGSRNTLVLGLRGIGPWWTTMNAVQVNVTSHARIWAAR